MTDDPSILHEDTSCGSSLENSEKQTLLKVKTNQLMLYNNKHPFTTTLKEDVAERENYYSRPRNSVADLYKEKISVVLDTY
jgi:hypothetical protein